MHVVWLFSERSVCDIEKYVMDAVVEHNKLAATVDTWVDFAVHFWV